MNNQIGFCPWCGERTAVIHEDSLWFVACLSCDAESPPKDDKESVLKYLKPRGGLDRVADILGCEQPCIELICHELYLVDEKMATARKTIATLRAEVQKLKAICDI